MHDKTRTQAICFALAVVLLCLYSSAQQVSTSGNRDGSIHGIEPISLNQGPRLARDVRRPCPQVRSHIAEPVNLDSGLVVYYPFNGNMSDLSGNGNDLHGTAVSLAADRFGNLGRAYEFSQDSSYMISKDTIHIMGDMPRSISVWLKSSASLASICDWGNTANVGGLSSMKLKGSRLVFNGNWQDVCAKQPVSRNAWTHGCFTYEKGVGTLYMDGVAQLNVSDVPLYALATNPTLFEVGYELWRGPSDWNAPFRGELDDIRVYNRALTEAEVRALYFEGSSSKIHLGSPNGGERYPTETNKAIEWVALDARNVTLEYSTDNGASWVGIAANVPADSCTYMWIVPNTPSDQCRVRVSDADDHSQFDVSDFAFTIYNPPRDPYVQHILTLVNRDSLVKTVRDLSGEDEVQINGSAARIISRQVRTTGNALAKSYVADRLSAYGLPVEIQNYDSLYPASANVIATQQSSSSSNREVIICANYDDMAIGDTMPGADDNASGVAAVLEAARILSRYQTDATVIYALWNDGATNSGGSYAYAQRGAQRGDSIVGVINLDMLGWDSNNDGKVDIHTNNIARSLSLADEMCLVNDLYNIDLVPIAYSPGTTASDHASFWTFEFSAIMLIEAYYGGDFNWYYYTSSDRIGFFNSDFFHNCAKLAIGTLATLAGIRNPMAVRRSEEFPDRATLCQNYPNPFNPTTKIQFTIVNRQLIIVKVFDLLGREVTTLVNEVKSPGAYTVEFDGSNLASGVYFYTLQAGEFTQSKKLVLLK